MAEVQSISIVQLQRPSGKSDYMHLEWETINLDTCAAVFTTDDSTTRQCQSCEVQGFVTDLKPREVIDTLFGRNMCSCPCSTPFMVKHIADLCLRDRRLRREGAADGFIALIRAPGNCHVALKWVYPLLGLINILCAIYQEKTEAEDATILETIHSAYWDILDVIYDDQHNWLPLVSTAFRSLAAKFICMVLLDPGMKSNLYDAKTLELVLKCWLERPTESRSLRKPILDAALLMLAEPDFRNNMPPKGFLATAQRVVLSTPSYLHAISSILIHPGCLAGGLMNDLTVIRLLLGKSETSLLRNPFVCHRMYVHVAKAMHRQALKGSRKRTPLTGTEGVLAEGFAIIEQLTTRANVLDLIADLALTTPFFELVSRFIRISVAKQDRCMPACVVSFVFDALLREPDSGSARETDGASGSIISPSSNPLFFETVSTAFARVARPMKVFLENSALTNPELSSEYLKVWDSMSLLYGLTEDAIRERHRVDRTCCNVDCSARMAFGRKPAKKRICVDCKAVLYCDRSCQKSDWPMHKAECRSGTLTKVIR